MHRRGVFSLEMIKEKQHTRIPPGMIKEKRHTRKVDVYSFGIVLWELLTALKPFHDMTPEQLAFAVSQKFHMEKFTKMIVNMVKREKLYASQGSLIILSQIENEYNIIELAFK